MRKRSWWDKPALRNAVTSKQGVGAASFASYPAPAGAHWEFVTENGATITENGVPVVALVGNS